MLGLLAATIAFQGQKTLFQQIGLRPTGKNGYEEYLQAADLLRTREANLLLRWTPGMTPPAPGTEGELAFTPSELDLFSRLPKLSPLDVRREAVSRFGKALDLIAAGNAKAVFDPRGDAGPDTLFPEYSAFRSISRLAVYASQVYAADGRTDRAIKALTDQLVFADNFGRSLIISNLVSTSCTAIALSGFADLLPRISRTDAMRIQTDVRPLLERPAAIRTAWPAETDFAIRSLTAALAPNSDPSKLIQPADEEESDPQAKSFAQQLTKSTPAQRQEILRSVRDQLEGRARAAARILAGPEKGWISGINQLAADEDRPSANVADYLVAMVSPLYTQLVVVTVRTRTQLRLLSLHAKIVQYRWDYGRYPDKVDDIDPLTGQGYVYEIRPDGSVRLASQGTKETGEIELKYKRKPEEPEVTP